MEGLWNEKTECLSKSKGVLKWAGDGAQWYSAGRADPSENQAQFLETTWEAQNYLQLQGIGALFLDSNITCIHTYIYTLTIN